MAMRRNKLQSAMEYLMAYGWAILIIAVVLGALFGLGFFDSANLAPKVAAGSCQVYRPSGPTTSSFINLEGTCNNELPQYVAQFDGSTSYITTGTTGLPLGSAARSVFAWIEVNNAISGGAAVFSYGTTSDPDLAKIQINPSYDIIFNQGAGLGFTTGTLAITKGTWYFVGYTYAFGSSNIILYLDGQAESGALSGGALGTVLPASNPASIGTAQTLTNFFPGQIANLQVYNTSLSANEITALYAEGIGGDPININNLAGWWPLNGNANDYSGNLNNGVPTNVIYTSSWTSGYTAP